MPAGIAMNWLTRLLTPPLAFACIMAFYMAVSVPQVQPISKPQTAPIPPTSTVDITPSQGSLVDWQPSVDQVIDQLEGWLSEEHPQQALNYGMANLAALYDTKLYLVFIEYLASVKPELSAAILQEQRAWLQLRKERTATARLVDGDGSLASYNASETYVYITHERIDSLSALMLEQ